MPEQVDNSPDNPFDPKTARVGDFFAPFFTIRFLTAEPQQGTVADAETGEEATVSIPQADTVVVANGDSRIVFTEDGRTNQFRSYATSLTVTNQGGVSMVELTLEPPLDDALVLIEQRVVQFNSIVVVKWGWSSNSGADDYISDEHYFVTMNPQMDVRGVDVSIKITGVDLFGYSSMKRETRRVYKRTEASEDNVVYDTDFKILESLAKKVNMRLNTALAPIALVSTTTTGPFGIPSVTVTPTNLPIHAKKPTNPREATTIEQNEKDWVFFKRICEMNRCDYFTIGQTIYIVDQNIARVRQYAYRLVFWNQPQNADDIPIYSFTTAPLPTLFFPAESKEVKCYSSNEDDLTTGVEAFDPQKMSDLEAIGERGAGGKSEADGRTLKISPNVQVVPNPAYAANETGRAMSCPSGQPNKEEHVKRIVRDANSLANQQMEVEIPGVPGLVPMQLVRVEGVSKVFSGPYIVLKVVHKITTSGYDCSVSLIREATTGDKETGKGERPVTGGNNPNQAPEGQAAEPVDGRTA